MAASRLFRKAANSHAAKAAPYIGMTLFNMSLFTAGLNAAARHRQQFEQLPPDEQARIRQRNAHLPPSGDAISVIGERMRDPNSTFKK